MQELRMAYRHCILALLHGLQSPAVLILMLQVSGDVMRHMDTWIEAKMQTEGC